MEKKLVGQDVIAGHVVPNKLLFTEPLDLVEQKTATYTDESSSIKVTAIIQTTSEGCKKIRFALAQKKPSFRILHLESSASITTVASSYAWKKAATLWGNYVQICALFSLFPPQCQ